MPTISVLIKPASGMCNMQCDYCFYCDEMKKRSQDSYGFMSEQTLKNQHHVPFNSINVDNTTSPKGRANISQ